MQLHEAHVMIEALQSLNDTPIIGTQIKALARCDLEDQSGKRYVLQAGDTLTVRFDNATFSR